MKPIALPYTPYVGDPVKLKTISEIETEMEEAIRMINDAALFGCFPGFYINSDKAKDTK
jgi:hypothetical protein